MITVIRGSESKRFAKPGYTVTDFQVAPPTMDRKLERLDGRNMTVDGGVTFHERSLYFSTWVHNVDKVDSYLHQSELFRFLVTRDELILQYDLMPGRQFRCRFDGYDINEEYNTLTNVTFKFQMSGPYIESIGTTQTALATDEDKWGMSSGILIDGEYVYTHTASPFIIYNAGDDVIDPRELPLTITFTGASTNLKIKNTTTNEEWAYTGTTNSTDVITLSGTRTTKRQQFTESIFSHTNKKLITLKRGENNFIISGATGAFTIKFETRFYYY